VFLPNPELVTNGTASNGVLDKSGKAGDSGEHPEALQGGVWVNADPVSDGFLREYPVMIINMGMFRYLDVLYATSERVS
jgi:hypothetical protein